MSTSAKRVAKSSRRTAPPQKAAYHHGNLRESLLLAAEAMLAAKGLHGTTLRDVAKAAGVSHAAPYHHFSSLNDLLAAVAERGFVALGDAMEVAAATPDTRERLLQIGQAYVRCAREQPARFRLMFAPQLNQANPYPTLQAASQRAFSLVMDAACAYDPVQGPELALTGWSLSHGLSNLLIDGALDHVPGAQEDPDALVRQLTLRALGSPTPNRVPGPSPRAKRTGKVP